MAVSEFFGGDNKFFKLLCEEIEFIRGNYIINYKSLHHQGDEVLVSSAIEKVMQKKYIATQDYLVALEDIGAFRPSCSKSLNIYSLIIILFPGT